MNVGFCSTPQSADWPSVRPLLLSSPPIVLKILRQRENEKFGSLRRLCPHSTVLCLYGNLIVLYSETNLFGAAPARQ